MLAKVMKLIEHRINKIANNSDVINEPDA